MPFPPSLARGFTRRRAFRAAVPFVSGLVLLLPGESRAQDQAMGAGAAFFDCDNDKDLDVFYLTPVGGMVLMRNEGGTGFTDVTAESIPAGIRHSGNAATGVAAADVNNDGATDLFITMNGPNFLLLNQGAGTFLGVASIAGVKGDFVLSSSIAFLDYDRDGLLDIYVANYEGYENYFYHALGINNDGVPYYEDVAPALGMDWAPNGQSDWTLGLLAFDYDNDGDTDLYLCNDYNGGGERLNPGDNILYRNEGDGTFADVTDFSGTRDTGWGMGTAHGDYDGDGWLDIFNTNFWEDVLYHNNGDGTFTEVTDEVGLNNQDWYYNGWGTAFLDVDNDGDLDLHVANGYITNGYDQKEDEPDQLWENLGPVQGQIRFVERTTVSGVNQIGDARGAAYGDFNNDGYVDFLVVNNEYVSGVGSPDIPSRCFFVNQKDGTFRDRAQALGFRSNIPDPGKVPGYRNTESFHWIQVLPRGTVSNRSAIGARVTVRAGDRVWIQDHGASSYLSGNSPYLHFGLGTATVVDEVVVRFPSGVENRWTNVAVDQRIELTEDPTPVRLAAFSVAPRGSGVEVAWRYTDDGEGPRFLVVRDGAGSSLALGDWTDAPGGAGRVFDPAPPRETPLTYTLTALLRDGTRDVLGAREIRLPAGPAVALGAAYPNPFRGATRIPVSAPGETRVEILDVGGRLVRTLAVAPGEPHTFWSGDDTQGRPVPAGAYFYRIAGRSEARRLVLLPD